MPRESRARPGRKRLPRGATGQTGRMDVGMLARGLTLNRIAFGAGLIVAPRLYARTWIGSDGAGDDRAKLLARGLGARDLVLGTGGLLALRDGDEPRARQWFLAQGISDGVDLVATLAAGRAVPAPARAFAAIVAAGSAAIAGAYVMRTAST
jgi:hypothetical protein